jgi:hypothetical protein
MGASDRTVRHLRLRAPDAQAATHAAHRLEDALRCASLPDTGERMLLVRRLHLGRLPAGLSSQSLSLLIEQRVAAVGGEWVHGGEARAARSDTVFFANRLQAAQAALQRRATGLPLEGWHWPLALPGVSPQAPAGEFVAQLLDAVSQWPEAPVALPALVSSVQTPTARTWWREHLPPAWRVRLAQFDPDESQQRQAPMRPVPPPTDINLPQEDMPHHRFVAPVAGHAHVPDARADDTAARHERTPHRGDVQRGGPGAQTASTTHESGVAPEVPRRVAEPPSQVPNEPVPIAPVPSDRVAVAPAEARTSASPFEVFATQAGGLLFLWPVLDRLGFAAWDAAHPDAWLVPRVLRLALQRLRVPDDDPAWALLVDLPGMQTGSPASDTMAAQWLQSCRHHARRVLRIGLASLVLRPAGLQWSATHIDVHFRLRDADIRVRRAALDIDPGWVGGLQRVVGFHYDREDFPS